MTTRSRRLRRVLAPTAVLLSASMALLGCASGSTDAGSGDSDNAAVTPVEGGTLRVGLIAGSACFDPARLAASYERTMVSALADSLLDMDAEGTIYPSLAESYEVNDDATSYTFHLKEGVTFADGTPLTANAVKTTFDYIKDVLTSALSSRGGGYLAYYTGTTVVDELTAQVDFSAPSVPFLAGVTTPIMAILSEASAELTPEERCNGAWTGAGLYKMTAYEQNQSATFEKRPEYNWGPDSAENKGAAYIDTIEWQVIGTANARSGAVRSGELHITQDPPNQDVPGLEAAGIEIEPAIMSGVPASLWIDSTDPGLDDVAIRRAMISGFDRESAVMAVMQGVYQPATTVLTGSFPAAVDYSDDLLAFDPEAAVEELEAAGWELGADGVREKDGLKAEFTVNYATAFGVYYTAILQLFQQNMKDIGIAITLQDLPPAQLIASAADRSVQIYATSLTDADPDVLRSNSTNLLPDVELKDAIGLTKLYEQSVVTADPEQRKAVYADIQETLLSEGLMNPIWDGMVVWAYGDGVEGSRLDFLGSLRFNDIFLAE